MVLEKRIPENFCDKIIEYVDHINKFEDQGVMGDTESHKSDNRVFQGYSLSLNQSKISDIVFHGHTNEIIKQNYINYKFKFPQLQTSKLTQVDILKYTPGGKYGAHTDHGFGCERTLTVILNLNENYEGGDFVFFHQDNKTEMKRVSCKKGTVIMFPSNFLYPHAVEPVTKGTRYSIVSWLL